MNKEEKAIFYLAINKTTNAVEFISHEPLEENDDIYGFLIEEDVLSFCHSHPRLTEGGYFLLDNEVIENAEETQKCLANSEKTRLRELREKECFAIVNRGQLWYTSLTVTQMLELTNWYKAWLDVTDTLTPPQKPGWLE